MGKALEPRMKVEIWSDMMCPFCYIGKRRFESALDRFDRKGEVEVAWKSFQLDPGIQGAAGQGVAEYLAERKGIPLEQARAMNDRVARSAREVGLEFDFGKAVVANSFDAHRLVQLAKTHGLDGAVEERLFKAYFTEGHDISDKQVLVGLGVEAGLDEAEASGALEGNAFAAEVSRDISEARQLGVQGVPFFAFDRKYAVSGAQGTDVFLGALSQSLEAFRASRPPVPDQEGAEGQACAPDGTCNW